MFEKVNPSHPDKVADRIAGAIVDIAYTKNRNPKIAVEVLLGHNKCFIISESSENITEDEVKAVVSRIVGPVELNYTQVQQDPILAKNQSEEIRCGDNGIFKGSPITYEQKSLTKIARQIYSLCPYDGKYILSMPKNIILQMPRNALCMYLTICQSHAYKAELCDIFSGAKINPLGYWEGGINVDAGATNRKLGSDMGDAVTGGGLHGKDLSKADVSLNIYCHLKAQASGKPYELTCSIGDETVDGKPYSHIVKIAREYIEDIGGFEKFAEWGLIR